MSTDMQYLALAIGVIATAAGAGAGYGWLRRAVNNHDHRFVRLEKLIENSRIELKREIRDHGYQNCPLVKNHQGGGS